MKHLFTFGVLLCILGGHLFAAADALKPNVIINLDDDPAETKNLWS